MPTSFANPIVFEFDFQTFLSATLGRQVYAPVRSGRKYVAPVGIVDDPIVTYARISSNRDYLMSGSPTGIVDCNFQVDVFGFTSDDVLIVAEQVRYCLQGFRGACGDSTILMCDLENQITSFLENDDTKKPGVYRVISEYRICYREPFPVAPVTGGVVSDLPTFGLGYFGRGYFGRGY